MIGISNKLQQLINFEVHMITYDITTAYKSTDWFHLLSFFSVCNSKTVPVAEVDSIAYQQIAITMSGENTEGNATTRAITELQESLWLMCEETKFIKTI